MSPLPGLDRACLAEFLGTFLLVFAGTGAIVVNAATGGAVTHVGVAMCFGLVVMLLIIALGDISGAHFNPAVTAAFLLAGQVRPTRAAAYIVTQLAAALVASLAVYILFGDHAMLGATQPRDPTPAGVARVFALELLLTFFLMTVIFCVATGPRETGILAGIAIGGTIGLEALFAGPITGASTNPARSLGPAVVAGRLDHLWLYLLAPTAGSLLAVPVAAVLRPRPRPAGPLPAPPADL
ncbi:MAG: aquaporin [Tepidisphaerales bacterium]